MQCIDHLLITARVPSNVTATAISEFRSLAHQVATEGRASSAGFRNQADRKAAMLALMDRQMIVDHLAQAERHVALGAQHIARQREIIRELQGGGHNASEAKLLLAQFLDLQELHKADRSRLAEELTDYDAKASSGLGRGPL